MVKKHKVILLETTEADGAIIKTKDTPTSKGLFWSYKPKAYYTQAYLKAANTKSYHLYILSDGEIKKGDWVITPSDFTPHKIQKVIKTKMNGDIMTMNVLHHKEEFSKIIATTNPSLNLPSIPKSFIESFSKEPVDEVELEYTSYKNLEGVDIDDPTKLNYTIYEELSLIDNEVVISPKEREYIFTEEQFQFECNLKIEFQQYLIDVVKAGNTLVNLYEGENSFREVEAKSRLKLANSILSKYNEILKKKP